MRFYDPTPRLRFVERDIISEANPSLSRTTKILQQFWKDRFDEERDGEWRDVPLEQENASRESV